MRLINAYQTKKNREITMSSVLKNFQRETINLLMIELFGIYIHNVYPALEEIKYEIENDFDNANFNELTRITIFSKILLEQTHRTPDDEYIFKDTFSAIYKCFEYLLTNDIEDELIKIQCFFEINSVRDGDIEYYLNRRKKNIFKR